MYLISDTLVGALFFWAQIRHIWKGFICEQRSRTFFTNPMGLWKRARIFTEISHYYLLFKLGKFAN